MRTVRKRKSPSARRSFRARSRRLSRQTRRSLLLVFALIFAPVAARTARAACVELGALPSIPTGATTTPWSVTGADVDVDGDGDTDAASVAINSNRVSWHRNLGTGVFDDGYDSDSNTACWSGSTP